MEKDNQIFSKKINNLKAFTLAEALVAILIMLMVTSIVAAGIPAAKRAYDNVVVASNAELLMSTTMSALRNELGMATNVDVESDEKTIIFFSQNNDSLSKISLYSGGSKYPSGTIMYQANAGFSAGEEFGLPAVPGGDEVPLVSRKSSDEKLFATYESVSVSEDGDVLTFKNLEVKHEDGRTLAPQGREKDDKGDVYTSIRLIANSNETD